METSWGTDDTDPYSWPYTSGSWPDFTDEAAAAGAGGTGLGIGDEMPDAILTDQYGNDLQLYDFYGHVILLVVSSAWSASDVLLTEDLPSLWSEHRDRGFIVIQLLLEDEAGYSAEVSDLVTWADDMNLAYPVVLDPAETLFDDLIGAGTFSSAIPSYLLLDRTMTIDSSYMGYGQTEHESRISALTSQ
jgi:hypothetical protein